MPNKTLYVRDADLPLFEQAQEMLGESTSAMFAEFLRERVTNMRPEEGRIVALIDEIKADREAASANDKLPQFLAGEYDEAEAYASKALTRFRRGDIREAKV